jgi:hypothetical protein
VYLALFLAAASYLISTKENLLTILNQFTGRVEKKIKANELTLRTGQFPMPRRLSR